MPPIYRAFIKKCIYMAGALFNVLITLLSFNTCKLIFLDISLVRVAVS